MKREKIDIPVIFVTIEIALICLCTKRKKSFDSG